MPEINFSELCGFSDKQWMASEVADAHKYPLFGGSRGPGKSYWLRWYAVRRLMNWAGQGHRNVNVMLACEDYPSLKDRHISKISSEFPSRLGVLKETQQKGLGFHLRPRYGGGSILLRNLDDPTKYMSAEFAGILIDEITKNPVSTFDVLRGSLRWPGIKDTFLAGACNPSANWVRDYWIERDFPPQLEREANQFAFVPALPQDNPHLDPSYWQMLETLSGPLREAWLHGDWYAAVEGLVYENFNDDNVTDQEPLPDHSFDLAIDDGYIDPRATLFIQRQPGGDVLVFDELYETKTLEEESIRNIFDRCLSHFGNDRFRQELAKHKLEWDTMDDRERALTCVRFGLPKPELAAVSHEAVALQQRLRKANIMARNWLTVKAGGGGSTRLAAITLTRGLICDGKGHRAIKIHRRCRHLLDEIRAGYKYPEGKHGLETKPEDGNDHAANALESWVWLRTRQQGASMAWGDE
jgi:hypothetical protein